MNYYLLKNNHNINLLLDNPFRNNNVVTTFRKMLDADVFKSKIKQGYVYLLIKQNGNALACKKDLFNAIKFKEKRGRKKGNYCNQSELVKILTI